MPSVTEKCCLVRFFRRTVPEPCLPIPTVSDPSVTKCDTEFGARLYQRNSNSLRRVRRSRATGQVLSMRFWLMRSPLGPKNTYPFRPLHQNLFETYRTVSEGLKNTRRSLAHSRN